MSDGGLWAFCVQCAFEVPAVEKDGKVVLDEHTRATGTGTARNACTGGGTEATPQPGPEAKPKPFWYVVDPPESEDDDGDDTDTSGGE